MTEIALQQRVQQTPVSRVGVGFWPWFLQRVTGAGLIALLLAHFIINHYLNITEVEHHVLPDLVVFSNVADRFENAGYWIVSILLLSFTLFHGLNGIRNIAIDYGARGAVEKAVTGVLFGIGTAAFIFGIFVFAAFQ